MFWGLVLEPGKRYSTTVDKSFHVSMAALDISSVKSDSEILSVILECEGQENILCNLSKQLNILQSQLDLNFMTGDKVSFEIKGSGIVHLSGYLVPEDDDDEDYMNMQDYEDMEEEEEEETEESPKSKEKQKGKRRPDIPEINKSKKKKMKIGEEDSDEDEEEDDDSDEEEDDSDEEDDDIADSDEEEEVQVPSKKQQKTPQSANKKVQQTPNKQTPNIKQQQQSANKQTPLLNGSIPNQQQSGKKNKKKGNQGQETPKSANQNDVKAKNQKTPSSESGSPQLKKKTTLEGGIVVKDIREGNGPVAKNGQLVAVFYQGRLKSNNKMFDECKRGGPPFKFRLGKGEVIKGWDIGVNGMKVGGLRMITCPPNMAYGQKGSPPQIPPNSALVFQVELKAVN
ncbi:46 kDa FK506-binding nuclear protein-like isoform X2 [Lycorma delicatula]|uniref:46 kDa FK506-binding nuclear protein-like isoform X2 n=1 Tax=Lycorma delicatula TaxID=130591 RepID=UPI003F50FB3B